MSSPPGQGVLSRNVEVLPFRRKEKHPKSHADMSDKWVHPSSPLPQLLLWKKHREIIACASAVPQQGKGHLGKNLPPKSSLLDIPISPPCGFPRFVFWEGHSSGRV